MAHPTEAPPGLFTGAVWPSIWTGRHAGEHGYHCWQQITPGTYDFELHQIADKGLAADPFWVDLSARGLTSVLIDPPHVPLTEGLTGAQVLEWGGHDAVTPPLSDPPELVEEILDRHGEHPSWGNCNEHGRDAARFAHFRDQMVAGAAMKADLTLELQRRHRPDLLVTVFGESHCIGHQAWHLHDPDASDHDPSVVEVVGDPVLAVYRAVDAALGRVIDGLEPDTELFVLCSHGMGTHTDPTFLVDDVLLRLEASTKFGRLRSVLERCDRVDERLRAAGGPDALGRTKRLIGRCLARGFAGVAEMAGRRLHRKVFTWIHEAEFADRRWFQHPNNEPEAGIRFNLVGREPEGVVHPDELDAEIDWLTERLHELRDGRDRPIVRDVLRSRDLYDGPRLDVLPDVLVRWNRHPEMADTLRSPRIGEVHRSYHGARTGDHHPRGLLIHCGPNVEPGADAESIRVEQIATRVSAAFVADDTSLDRGVAATA